MTQLRIIFACLFFTLISTAAHADQKFTRRDIAEARYRSEKHKELLEKAYTVGQVLNSEIYGQEAAIQVIQTQLVQYLESFLSRKNEPVSVNLAGLSGIGKSAIVNKLIEMGFPVVHFDAQKYTKDQLDQFSRELANRVRNFTAHQEPLLLVIEEIDKVPEIVNGNQETSSSVIGALNQILSSGKLSTSYETLDFSNVMVITDMNISPEFIEIFSRDVLKEEKSFFDYTLEDIQALDHWLRNDPSATYKILSKTFRNNTVGRLAPITTVMSPLTREAYRRITAQMVLVATQTIAGDPNKGKRISVATDESFVNYIADKSIYAPSGARETVARAKLLAEQLINFGVKVNDPLGSTPERPRSIHLSYDQEKDAVIVTLTPYKLIETELQPLPSSSWELRYDENIKQFHIPYDEVITSKPNLPPPAHTLRPKHISQKMVFASRYPVLQKSTGDLKEFLNKNVLGQEAAVDLIDEDVQRFLGQGGNRTGQPIYRILSGFPGIGKSELMKRLGEKLKLPVIKVNMQRYTAAGDDAVKNFLKDVARSIDARKAEANGQFLLLIEEMDKLYELDPQTGRLVDRPVMAVLKDLMNDGYVSLRDDYGPITVDIRGQLTYFTMNFSVDRFDFSADPRLTTTDDVMAAWRRMSSSSMAIKELLGSMYLPDTVSRMMPRFMIMRPLEEADYKAIIVQQVSEVLRERFVNKDNLDTGKVSIELTPEFKDFLFSETVIPSEGARNTAISARALISVSLEKTLQGIARGSSLARKPVTVRLHYRPGRAAVVGSVRLTGPSDVKFEETYSERVTLTFPPVRQLGRMSAKRLLTAAHEFGHAFSRVRMGLRLEQVVVTSPKPGIGGYVKFPGRGFSAPEMIADIYSVLAARAFERIVLSDNPTANDSILQTTAGASGDIVSATMGLYNIIYELGLDPQGGIVDRNFSSVNRYASYQDLPPQLAEALGFILRDMENAMLADFLDAHPIDWYVEKIAALAHEGAMTETQFYQLTGYTDPGKSPQRVSIFDNARLRELFKDHLILPQTGETRARSARRADGQTQEQTFDGLMQKFRESLSKRLHSCEENLTAPK